MESLKISEKETRGKTTVNVSDGVDAVGFLKYKKGIFCNGKQKVANSIMQNRSFLQGLGVTSSAMNVIISVAENEGNLDAVNTWDNCFLTFGMFQWTTGEDAEPGELAALLSRIKNTAPEIFTKYYGKYGLDIELTSKTKGYLILDGKKLASAADKEKIRTETWAFYFWKSGQDPWIQSIQVQHALSRLDVFYKADEYKFQDFFISDLVKSEYGVALVLDNHVNRPGYVIPCLSQAMTLVGLDNPAKWSTAEEQKLLDEYIKTRITFGKTPMTDADKRAQKIGKFLEDGTISGTRGSFQYKSL